MSVRLPLLAVATLALAGCNFSKAPEEQAACDCKPAAAPAAKANATVETAETASTGTVTRVVHRKTPAVRRERRERRYYASEGSSTGYGGAYGRRYAGVSVSVSESESSSERYRYSESEERYGSSGGSAYGSGSSGYASTGGGYYAEGYGRDGRYGPPPRPRVRTYSLAGKDRDGYLTWPGKVED